MKKSFSKSIILLTCFLAVVSGCGGGGELVWHFDVVILGGTPSGIAAAVAASRRGENVCLIAEREHIGGMMASGLGNTDSGNPDLIGGIAREVFGRIEEHYKESYGKESKQYKDCSLGLRFEPHVAEKVFESLVEEEGITLFRGWVLEDCGFANNKITELCIRHRRSTRRDTVEGKIFIDATYTGDLFAEAGAPFSLGREGREVFGETLAGHIYQDTGTQEPLPGSTGKGDSLIQAYNYRLCLTDSARNMAPLPEPENYNPSRYRILYDYIRREEQVAPADFMIFIPLPNRKYDVNNWGYCWMSTDLIGGSRDYPEATWEERAGIEEMHREHILGLLKFLRTDPGVPAELREKFAGYSLAKDEFTDKSHMPFQLYVREARRLHGLYTFTQGDALTDTLKRDAVGMGGYPMDSHATGPWNYSYPWAEGFFIKPCRPYQIPYSIMVPAWLRNLLVSTCVSASHVGFGTLRMEPVFMIMGQAAGVAASLCLELNCEVDEAPVHVLQSILREQGAILSAEEARPWTGGL